MKCNPEKIEKIIKKNISNCHFSVERLAEELGISESYLRDKIFQIYCICPKNLIESIKLKQAIFLLNEGFNIQITAIKLGYTNTRTFRRVFKKWLDITPSECRELLIRHIGYEHSIIEDIQKTLQEKSQII
jgi:AraC-like DNA-binding protein